MRVLITQSNYVPWRGYFAAFREVDQVVLLDSVQYTRRDWRNRNRIRLDNVPRWLSIPVVAKGHYSLSIAAVRVRDTEWGSAHASLIEHAYRRSPHFGDLNEVSRLVATASHTMTLLTEINEFLLREFAARLEITTPITAVREPDDLGATERLACIAEDLGATTYVSGPAAKVYLDTDEFTRRGIAVEYLDYSALPSDPGGMIQDGGEYSLIDVIARCGWERARDLTMMK